MTFLLPRLGAGQEKRRRCAERRKAKDTKSSSAARWMKETANQNDRMKARRSYGAGGMSIYAGSVGIAFTLNGSDTP